MSTRKAPRALNKSAAEVAANAAAEKARKAASRKALREAKAAEQQTPAPAPAPVETPESVQHERNLEAARAEAAATGMSFEEACESMGIDPTGAPAPEAKARYAGPMLALVAARKNYVKAANGIQCNGDGLALLCGEYSRETVVAALVRALGLDANPYLHLNPGQQSMNLRNKARHALAAGLVKIEDIDACLKAASALKVAA